MNNIQTPKIAVVGYGYWGKNIVRNFHEIGALSAVCDNSKENLAVCRQKYPKCRYFDSYNDLLKDQSIQGIVIASPAKFHAEMVAAALSAGKDVFVEKPLSLDMKTGEFLVMLAQERNRILMVGHLLWYHDAVVQLKKLIDAKELGRILYIYSHRLNLGKIRTEENVLWSFAPHDISVILGLLGEMPDKIQSSGGVYLHQAVADVTMSTLSFLSGVKAHIFVSWLNSFKEQRLVVIGDRKMAVFDDLQKDHKLWLQPYSVVDGERAVFSNKSNIEPIQVNDQEPLRVECEHFLECIRTRAVPRTDGVEALRVLSVLSKCQESLEMNTEIKSPPISAVRKKYSVHESAFIDEKVEIGEGTSIWNVSHILTGSKIGKNCRIGQNVVIGPRVSVGNGVKIQNNVSVYEGVTLEDDVFCGPSMVFTNVINPRSSVPRMHELKPTLIQQGATLGANSTILCGVTIGRAAFVGAGAVVTTDVPAFGLVVGVPARLVGWMCRCGIKIKFKGAMAKCSGCGAAYTKKKNRVQLK